MFLWAKSQDTERKYHALEPDGWGETVCHRGFIWPLTVLRSVPIDEKCNTCRNLTR